MFDSCIIKQLDGCMWREMPIKRYESQSDRSMSTVTFNNKFDVYESNVTLFELSCCSHGNTILVGLFWLVLFEHHFVYYPSKLWRRIATNYNHIAFQREGERIYLDDDRSCCVWAAVLMKSVRSGAQKTRWTSCMWCCSVQSSAGVWAKPESDTNMKTLCIIYKHPVVADGGTRTQAQMGTYLPTQMH